MVTASSSGGLDATELAGALPAVPRLVLLTGVMAVGKSTVAQLLAEQLPRAAHVRGDAFRRFMVTGSVDPTPSMPPEAMRQLLLPT